VLVFDVRSAFKRHRSAAVDIGGIDFSLGETEFGEKVEVGGVHALGCEAQDGRAELLAERPFVEHETDIEGSRERGLNGC
jgi:hypothetical protein